MELKELIDYYGDLKNKASALYKQYKEMQPEIENAKQALQIKLDQIGLKSAKSGAYGVSIVTKPNIIVQDERSVKEWLERVPNIEMDTFYGLKLTNVKNFALQTLKETGEVMAGTTFENRETLSVKKVTKK